MRRNALIVLFLAGAVAPPSPSEETGATLKTLFTHDALASIWKSTHCDLSALPDGGIRATFWKGYGMTGFETTRLPSTDWSAWKSFRLDVENPYNAPFSVYVRISNSAAHPKEETYTGGTFDGFVIGPGRNTVDVGLDRMQSPDERPVDPKRIAYLGIFFQPLFLRDGMDLKFAEDRAFRLSNPRLTTESAKLQKQPYAEPLFAGTDPALAVLRKQAEEAVGRLGKAIEQAKARGVETAYAEIVPFLADIAFRKRLVAFWQDRTNEQRRALSVLLEEAQEEERILRAALDGNGSQRSVPTVPDYGELTLRDRYFRLGNAPVLLFGMLYNGRGPLARWFADSRTDYGTQLVAGATRHDVERQPIWTAYQKYPDTHRVGWDHSDHIIRDRSSWEVLGPPVSICLESPHSREAIAARIESFERANAGNRRQLVQNLGYEYTYVCYCDYTRRMWTDWLRRKHARIGVANAVWGTQFSDFAAVPTPRPENAGMNRALWFDWSSFNLHRFLEQIRWTRDQIRRWETAKPLTVGSPYFAFHPSFWTAVDEEELADSGITGVVLEENYELDTLMPEYLHALAGGKPVADFEYHGEIHQILPSFLHGDAAISMWWWNDQKHWTPNEPINEWASSFPQSYTIPLRDVGKAMRDALDLRRLGREIAALGSAPRPIVLLYSKTSMLQHLPEQSRAMESFPYLSALRRIYNASQSEGLYVGLTTEKKILADDLKQRRVLVMPAAEFVPAPVAAEVLRWVERGGTLIVSPDSLLSDEYARPARTLESLGVRLVRREPARLKRGETLVTRYNEADLPRMPFAAEKMPLVAAGGRQILECSPSLVIGRFQDGTPALLRVPRGRGVVYWLAAPLEPLSWGRLLSFAAVRSDLSRDLRVFRAGGGTAPEVEYRVTDFGGSRLAYLYNNSGSDLRLELQPAFSFRSILDRRHEKPVESRVLLLPARETAILEFQR